MDLHFSPGSACKQTANPGGEPSSQPRGGYGGGARAARGRPVTWVVSVSLGLVCWSRHPLSASSPLPGKAVSPGTCRSSQDGRTHGEQQSLVFKKRVLTEATDIEENLGEQGIVSGARERIVSP